MIVRGTDPPGRAFASHRDVHVGVQVGRAAVGLVPGDTAAPEWALDVRYDGDFRDEKGGPRCGRYDPPAIAWTVE